MPGKSALFATLQIVTTAAVLVCRHPSTSDSKKQQQQQRRRRQQQQRGQQQQQQQGKQKSAAVERNLPVVPRPALQLHDLWLGVGSSSVVHGGLWQGHPAAYKCLSVHGWVPRNSYMWEWRVLQHLRPLWGKCVPAIYAHGLMEDEDEYFIAMARLKGRPLCDLPQPLPIAVQQAAVRALDEVHARNVLHGDISLDHFMLVSEGPSPVVMLYDFGRSMLGASDVQCGAERRQLLELL